MTLEQLLSKKGYSTQEIKDLEPLLNNAKFRRDLESELTTWETEATKAKSDLDKYDEWFTNEITPEHEKLIKRVADAEASAAAEKARFEAYQKSGMRRQAQDQDPAAAAAAAEEERKKAEAAAKAAGLDPTKFVSAEVFQQTVDRTGEAMANAIDIVTEHMQLFPGQYLSMDKLRTEAREAKQPVRKYWETKYKVPERRTEITAKAENDRAEKLRQEGYQKAVVEFGGSNPNLRPIAPSNSPFIARKKADAGKQPWEKNENELSRDRIEKAIEKAAKRGELIPV